jgi:seryl-tRNA synthetase
MLQLNLIRDNADFVIERLAVKNFNGKDAVQQILSVDEKRRTTQTKLDTLLKQLQPVVKRNR